MIIHRGAGLLPTPPNLFSKEWEKSGGKNRSWHLHSNVKLHHGVASGGQVLYGLGVTGYGVGMGLFPLIAEFIRGTYGWRGGLLILSALMAHIIPCAAKINLDVDKMDKQLNGSHSSYLAIPDSEKVCPEGCERKTNRQGRARDQSGNNTTQDGVCRRITTIIRQSDFFVDPYFNAAHVVNISFSMVYACWHSFIVPHALERGISIRYTIILTFIASIGNIISRAAVGILTKNIFHPTDVYIFATLVSIVSLLCDVYFVNCVAMIMTSCFSAMSIGGRLVRLHLILIEISNNVEAATPLCILGDGPPKVAGDLSLEEWLEEFSSYTTHYQLSGEAKAQCCRSFGWSAKEEVLCRDEDAKG
nr:monocarboxylate transporter 12-like [Lytechinus pictus]